MPFLSFPYPREMKHGSLTSEQFPLRNETPGSNVEQIFDLGVYQESDESVMRSGLYVQFVEPI
jgi:hypothetical protein